MFPRNDLGIDFIEQNIFIACDYSTFWCIVIEYVLVCRCKEEKIICCYAIVIIRSWRNITLKIIYWNYPRFLKTFLSCIQNIAIDYKVWFEKAKEANFPANKLRDAYWLQGSMSSLKNRKQWDFRKSISSPVRLDFFHT